MITPIKTMTISQILERQDDLLVSANDIKELAKNERAKTIDEMKSEIISLINSNFHDLDDYITFDEVIGFITQVCLEGNSEGRVLASVDMEKIVKMTITDDIEKSNFNPQMLKSCMDTSYQSGYVQGRADAIEEYSSKLWQVIEKATVNCKLDFTIDDLHNLEIIIKGLAEEMKGGSNNGKN